MDLPEEYLVVGESKSQLLVEEIFCFDNVGDQSVGVGVVLGLFR